MAAQTRNVLVWIMILQVGYFLSGCMPRLPVRTGKKIQEDQLQALRPGETTKKQIFGQFGAPMAIVGKDEIVAVLSPTAWTGNHLKIGNHEEIDSNPFIELFSDHPLSEYHRVYYYYSSWSTGTSYFLFVGSHETSKTTIDRLWILINEKTGQMEDYHFKKGS